MAEPPPEPEELVRSNGFISVPSAKYLNPSVAHHALAQSGTISPPARNM